MYSDPQNRELKRIGFFPLTADPIHYGHLHGALKVLKTYDLDCIYIQICGDIPNHKPSKASKEHRHAMARLAVEEFSPILTYTSLGFDNCLVGEELFLDFIYEKYNGSVEEFYYIAGADNEQIVLERFNENKPRYKDKVIEIVFLAREDHQFSSNSKFVTCHTTYSSTLFREHIDHSFVPAAVVSYCRNHNLYGY